MYEEEELSPSKGFPFALVVSRGAKDGVGFERVDSESEGSENEEASEARRGSGKVMRVSWLTDGFLSRPIVCKTLPTTSRPRLFSSRVR